MNISPFAPGPTVTLAVGAASSNVQLGGAGASLEVQNAGSTTVFVKLGGPTVAAATSDYPVLAGQSKMIGRDTGSTYLAAIAPSGTATVYATTGEGL